MRKNFRISSDNTEKRHELSFCFLSLVLHKFSDLNILHCKYIPMSPILKTDMVSNIKIRFIKGFVAIEYFLYDKKSQLGKSIIIRARKNMRILFDYFCKSWILLNFFSSDDQIVRHSYDGFIAFNIIRNWDPNSSSVCFSEICWIDDLLVNEYSVGFEPIFIDLIFCVFCKLLSLLQI